MNIMQKNRQTRDLNVKTCLEMGVIVAILAAIPEYAALKALLDAYMGRLEELQIKQFTYLRGLIAARMAWRTKTIAACLQLAAPLVALAVKTDDEALLAEATVTKSSLESLNYNELAAKSQKLQGLGSTHAPALVVYLITLAFLDGMETINSNYREALLAAQTGKTEQKQITTDIALTLKEIDEVIIRISLIVETLKESQPVFYELFRTAYRLINPATSTLSASGYVLDGLTGEAIVKCRLRIVDFVPLPEPTISDEKVAVVLAKKTSPSYTELTKSVKLSSPFGAFRYRNLANGTYVLAAYRSGYEETRVTFYVNNGECAELYIRMQKVITDAA